MMNAGELVSVLEQAAHMCSRYDAHTLDEAVAVGAARRACREAAREIAVEDGEGQQAVEAPDAAVQASAMTPELAVVSEFALRA